MRETGRGCFDLRLLVVLAAPPYGRQATFCFDAATGALARTEIVRPEATDREQAVEIRSTVVDADLAPPPGQPGP